MDDIAHRLTGDSPEWMPMVVVVMIVIIVAGIYGLANGSMWTHTHAQRRLYVPLSLSLFLSLQWCARCIQLIVEKRQGRESQGNNRQDRLCILYCVSILISENMDRRGRVHCKRLFLLSFFLFVRGKEEFLTWLHSSCSMLYRARGESGEEKDDGGDDDDPGGKQREGKVIQ